MTKGKLAKVLEKHKHWLNKDCDGWETMRADLTGADLRGADLTGADLRGADLTGADLRYADLRYAYLRYADLRYADLRGADLRGADLRYAKNVPFIPMYCPDTGAFVAWKKCRNNLIVKLQIPEDAIRMSATGTKCRSNKAVVLAVENIDGKDAGNEAVSQHDANFVYRVGETVSVENFDTNRWNECAPGIHFFINRQEAVQY